MRHSSISKFGAIERVALLLPCPSCCLDRAALIQIGYVPVRLSSAQREACQNFTAASKTLGEFATEPEKYSYFKWLDNFSLGR